MARRARRGAAVASPLRTGGPTRSARRSRATWAQAGLGAAGFVVLVWLIEILDAVLGNRLDGYGVQPREGEGLLGVVLAPLLHGGWGHLAANTVPALVLLFLVLLSGIARGLLVTAVIWVVGGVGVWLVAPDDTVHLGASVLIFGWLVHLMARGFFSRRPGEIALGVVVFLLYGGVLLGVLPGQPGVSWQGHLFGAVGGALAAYVVGARETRTR